MENILEIYGLKMIIWPIILLLLMLIIVLVEIIRIFQQNKSLIKELDYQRRHHRHYQYKYLELKTEVENLADNLLDICNNITLKDLDKSEKITSSIAKRLLELEIINKD